jgi:putative redox protein
MELMWILKRQRQEVTGLKISLAGTKRKKEPQYYEDVRVEYAIRGRKLKDSAVKRALDMAVERYCPVRGMLRPEVRVTTSYRIEEEQ